MAIVHMGELKTGYTFVHCQKLVVLIDGKDLSSK
jgi:hypothetical protein